MLYEYIITFDREVNYAWSRSLTWARAVFYVNRYLGLVLSSLGLFISILPPSYLVSDFPILAALHADGRQEVNPMSLQAKPSAALNRTVGTAVLSCRKLFELPLLSRSWCMPVSP